ncbi:MAG: hypothetical protein ACK4MQ_06420 [Hyphomonas sp.]
MDVFTMVAIVVVATMAYAAYEMHMKARMKAGRSKEGDREVDAMRADIDRLKERVRVLEKIVTDQERQLSDDIRSLA